MTSHRIIDNSKQYGRPRKTKETVCSLKHIVGCHTCNFHAG